MEKPHSLAEGFGSSGPGANLKSRFIMIFARKGFIRIQEHLRLNQPKGKGVDYPLQLGRGPIAH